MKGASSTPTLRSEYHRAAVAATASPPTRERDAATATRARTKPPVERVGSEVIVAKPTGCPGAAGRGAVLFTLRFRGSHPVTVG